MENGPLTGRVCLSKGGQVSHRLLTGMLCSYREAESLSKSRALTRRPGLSQVGRASHREAGPLTGRQGLSKGGQSSHGEAKPLKERSDISQGGRPDLSQRGRASNRVIHTLQNILMKSLFLSNV